MVQFVKVVFNLLFSASTGVEVNAECAVIVGHDKRPYLWRQFHIADKVIAVFNRKSHFK